MELPEHKALFEDLKKAKARRIQEQNAMFAAPRDPRQMGVLSTQAFDKATERERQIGGALQALANEARDRFYEMMRAQGQGQRIDSKEAQRLKAVAEEAYSDLAGILGDTGRPVTGPIGRAA